tara:strand:- start:70 stop:537 length:468 start_codon:yes stop_codon:yes gene_type:complete
VKTYQEFITELNKFEAAMKAGKLGAKALKRVFGPGPFKINTTKVTNPLANALFKKQGLKKRIKPRYEVDTTDILKLRKKNKPVPFGEKDKFSKLATNRKSIHPPTADAAQKKIDDTFMDLTLKKVKRRGDKVNKLKRMFGNPDMGNPGTSFKDTR